MQIFETKRLIEQAKYDDATVIREDAKVWPAGDVVEGIEKRSFNI
jgi:hypothetical protein